MRQMKKLIPLFSIAATAFVMTACNSNPKIAGQSTTPAAAVQAPTVLQDTSGLAEYQAWKVMNEMKDSKDYGQPEEAVAATAPVRKAPRVSSPSRAVNHRTETPPPPAPAPVYTPQAPASTAPDARAGSTASTGAGTDASTGAGTGETAKVDEKKGMSNKTKGAVIGGVVGAGAGAVIYKKNPVVGAVVGAVLGAGGGYVIGGKVDKKKSGQLN
jgi:hypothetical protein